MFNAPNCHGVYHTFEMNATGMVIIKFLEVVITDDGNQSTPGHKSVELMSMTNILSVVCVYSALRK
jgi:hypothetical protein